MKLTRNNRTKRYEADFNPQIDDPVNVQRLYDFGMTKDEALKACRDEIRGKEAWVTWWLQEDISQARCHMDSPREPTDRELKAKSKLDDIIIKEIVSILSSESPDKNRIKEISTEHYQGQLKVSMHAADQGLLLFKARQREHSVLAEIEKLYDPNRSYLA